jgi:endonuclease YncB( thermonuclease family)
MAWVFDRYVVDRTLYPLQDVARSDRLGLWADAAPVPPWEWRKTKGVLEYRAPIREQGQ